MAMAMHGNLRDFAATEILQLLATQKKSGCLKLDSETQPVRFYMHEGRIISARPPGLQEDDPLLVLLRRSNRLSDEQFHGIQTLHQESGRDLEDLLVNGHYLEAEELATFLERQILDQLLHCVQWSAGTYAFDPNERWPNTPIARLSVEASVIEAARRVDEQKRQLKTFENPHMILAVRDLPDPDVQVNDDELEMFELVDGRRTVLQIVEAAPLLEYEAYEALHRMLEANWIEIVGRTAPEGQPAASPLALPFDPTRPRPTGPLVLIKEVAMSMLVVIASMGGWLGAQALRIETGPAGEDLYARAQIHEVRYALDLYRYERGRYPTSLDTMRTGWWLPADRLVVEGHPLSYQVSEDGQSYTLRLD